MTKFERCFQCDEPTGRAGRHDDSIYDTEDGGPYCVDCWEKFITNKETVSKDRPTIEERIQALGTRHFSQHDIRWVAEAHAAAEVKAATKELQRQIDVYREDRDGWRDAACAQSDANNKLYQRAIKAERERDQARNDSAAWAKASSEHASKTNSRLITLERDFAAFEWAEAERMRKILCPVQQVLERHSQAEYTDTPVLSPLEEKAWKLYCNTTAGCMSARDFWHELSGEDKKSYLTKVLADELIAGVQNEILKSFDRTIE